jgi:APA family basic amino acid/polyamine antiporter
MLVVSGWALAMNAVMGTYSGWNTAVYFSEENTNASRSLPKSLFGGLTTVAIIYVLVNAALLYAMPVASISASKLPAADFVTQLWGGTGGTLITSLAICSVLGVMNAALLFVPRIGFALSRDGYLPSQVAYVNSGGTPATALFVLVLISLVFAFSGTYETLLEIAVFIVLLVDSAVYAALFVLRRREPELARPFRAIGYPVLPAAALAAALLILGLFVAGNTTNSVIAIGLVIATYPVFLIARWFMKGSEAMRPAS